MKTRTLAFAIAALLAGCADPQTAGQQVGQSLYNASVDTGQALATAGTRTGEAIQNAGASLRSAFSPPPLAVAPYPAPIDQQALPPPGPPQGQFFQRYNPPGYPASTGEAGDAAPAPANPAMGY